MAVNAQMKKLSQSIEKLSGSEAKSLLFNIMHRIKIMKDSEDLREITLDEIYHYMPNKMKKIL